MNTDTIMATNQEKKNPPVDALTCSNRCMSREFIPNAVPTRAITVVVIAIEVTFITSIPIVASGQP